MIKEIKKYFFVLFFLISSFVIFSVTAYHHLMDYRLRNYGIVVETLTYNIKEVKKGHQIDYRFVYQHHLYQGKYVLKEFVDGPLQVVADPRFPSFFHRPLKAHGVTHVWLSFLYVMSLALVFIAGKIFVKIRWRDLQLQKKEYLSWYKAKGSYLYRTGLGQSVAYTHQVGTQFYKGVTLPLKMDKVRLAQSVIVYVDPTNRSRSITSWEAQEYT